MSGINSQLIVCILVRAGIHVCGLWISKRVPCHLSCCLDGNLESCLNVLKSKLLLAVPPGFSYED